MSIDVIRLAREAGFRSGSIQLSVGDPIPFISPISATNCLVELERFAALVAAAEREEANRKANAGWALMCKKMVEAEREECAKLASDYGPSRPIMGKNPSEKIVGRWEGEQAASYGIAAAIRARKPA